MRILIVEDETLAAQRLRKLLVDIDPTVEVAAVVNSIVSTVDWLKGNDLPDLILMDVELADGQCFEIFKRIHITTPIIFTTSYDEYAIQAFKVNSVDYLLKPVGVDDLRASLYKYNTFHGSPTAIPVFEQLLQYFQKMKRTYRDRFLVKTGSRYISLEIDVIAYFYFEERLTFIKTWKGESFVIDFSLDELEQMLSPEHFFRVNRQYIIHHRAVVSIHDYFNSKLLLTLNPPAKQEVIISRERSSQFKSWMGK
jgi:two-component system, LytTR family, response regulator LytT